VKTTTLEKGTARPAGVSSGTSSGFWSRYRRRIIPILFIGPVALYVLIFFAYPLIFGIVMSVENFGFGALVHGSGPFVGVDNYRSVFAAPVTLTALRNTLIFTVGSLVFQVAIGLGIAVLLNRKFLLSKLFQRLILVPWLIPLLASGTIFSLLFAASNGFVNDVLIRLGIIHTPVPWLIDSGPALAAITIVNIWAGIPFNAIILYSGLQDIDAVYYEAARVDGANAWQRFWRITLPLLRPVLSIVLMLGVIFTVKTFDVVLVMTGGGPNNATQLLSTWAYTQAFSSFNFGDGAAIGNVLLIGCLIVAAFYVRSLRSHDGALPGTPPAGGQKSGA
jgi:multiple sugar transport system permease protein